MIDTIGARTAPAFIALSCVGFIASAPVQAAPQEQFAALASAVEDPTQERDQIVVTGAREKEQLDSPKAVAPVLDTPRSIVVIPREVISDTGSATLVEALRTVPGITFGAAEGGNPIGDRPFIRGSDAQGSTFLDGVRDIGGQSREVFAVEQVQIVRGSDSTTGGRGAAGGAINIISKLPQPETAISGALSYGTADYKRATIDTNVRVADNVAVRLNALYHDQDIAGRDALFSERWGVAPSITIGIDGPTRLTASYYHLSTDELPDSGFGYRYIASSSVSNGPAGFINSEPAVGDFTTAGGVRGNISADNFYGLADRDFRKTEVDQATLRFEHDFGDVTIRNTARYGHVAQDYIYTQPDDSQGNIFGFPSGGRNVGALPGGQFNTYTGGGRVWRRANSRTAVVESLIDQLDVYGSFDTGALKHSFAVGGEVSWETARRGTYVSANGAAINTGTGNGLTGQRCGTAPGTAPYNCADLFNPNPYDPWVNLQNGVPSAIVRSAPATQTLSNASTKAVYAFDSISLGETLIVNLGARYDRFESRVRLPVAGGVRPELRREDDLFNWQAGVVFKPVPAVSLYASYATAASPPNSLIGEGQEGNTLGTVGGIVGQDAADLLKVERNKSYEVGAKAELFNSRLGINVAAFRTDTSNARVTGDANTVAFIGDRRVDGIEVGINGRITRQWSVFGGYTYLDSEVRDGGFTAFTLPAGGGVAARTVLLPSVNSGKRFPQTPEHSFTLWSTFDVTRAFSLGGGAFYQSRVYGGFSDNRYVSGTGSSAVVVPATTVLARSVPSYWRFDATAAYSFNDRVSLRVNVQNLTDKRYFATAYASHYAQMAPGRSAFATLSVKY